MGVVLKDYFSWNGISVDKQAQCGCGSDFSSTQSRGSAGYVWAFGDTKGRSA